MDEGVDVGGYLVGAFPVWAVAGVGVEHESGAGDGVGHGGLFSGGKQGVLGSAEYEGGHGDAAQLGCVCVGEQAERDVAPDVRRGPAALGDEPVEERLRDGVVECAGLELAGELHRHRVGQVLDERCDLAAPRFGERRGHPVLFGQSYFAALQALTGDVGAQRVLEKAGTRLALIDSPNAGVRFAVDRREDLA